MFMRIFTLSTLFFLFILSGCSNTSKKTYSLYSKIPSEQSDFNLPLPPTSSVGERNLKLWATVYYIYSAPPLKDNTTGRPFYNSKGEVISDNVSLRDWCLGAIEGTIKTTLNNSPVILNYASKSKGEKFVDCISVLNPSPERAWKFTFTGNSSFTKITSNYGKGVKNMDLIPYRTIAADNLSKNLKPGTVIFIKEARGAPIVLPSKTTVVHDGYFYVGDTGGAIKDNHIDVFCGITKTCLNTFAKSTPKHQFNAQIITDNSIINRLKEIHTPTL
ncbi:3D domain-containing protein [Klebsiella variicola]|uniref:3D domain-containing protein n=1 Tax=Klebsiella variicola TaxID=244366 RepID=UPI00109CC907|nr:3D domain-containing protein [Klebsiella variicola]VGP82701.1 hypothetical protein SB5610_01465 [Klebsiella variicola]